jgi:hypothetical protein
MRRVLLTTAVLGALALAAHAQSREPAPQPPPSAYTASWVANSFALKLDMDLGLGSEYWQHVLDRAPSDLYVFPDGTVTTNASYDENGADGSVFTTDGVMIGCQSGRGSAVTGDGTYIYRSGDGGDAGRGEKNWIVRWKPTDRMTYWQNDWRNKKWSRFRIDEKARITGLAAKDGELYVSDAAANAVKVFDLDAYPKPGTDLPNPVQPVRSFPLERPGHLAFDDGGRLWAIQTCVKGEDIRRDPKPKPGTWAPFNPAVEWGGIVAPGRVVCCNPRDGRIITTLGDLSEPMDLAYSTKDKMLLVAARGTDHQIRFYSDLDAKPKLARTFGAKGGIFASGGALGQRGEVKPQKLHPPTGVGVDAKGNLYVSGGSGPADYSDYWPVVIESYAPDGTLRWQRSGHTFMDTAWYDPVGDEMYTAVSRLGMDWSKTAPGSEWSYKALILDRQRYPQDPRNCGCASIIRVIHINGHKLLYDGSDGKINAYRFTPESGEIGVWCAAVGGGHGPLGWTTYVWSDRNGNAKMDLDEIQKGGLSGKEGKDVDEKGGIWLPAGDGKGIVHYPLDGIDPNGIPTYSVETMKVYPIPEDNPFRDGLAGGSSGIEQLRYNAATDTLVVGGFTHEYPQHPSDGYSGFGRLIACYRNFTTNPVTAWQILVPRHEIQSDKPRSMAMAGDYVFVAYIKNQRVKVYRKADGAFVGNLDPFRTPGLNNGTLLDYQQFGLSAGVRKNGEYVLGVYDSLDNKAFLYRWQPSKDAPAKPPAPPVLVAVGGDRKITVHWDKVASDGEYRLYRGLTPGNETLYQDHLKQAEFVDEGAADGKAYCYRASAVNAQGESPQSFWFMAQAYGVPHAVPGRIEAENFDPGGEGVGFHAPPAKDGADKHRRWKLYRPEEGAPIGSEGLGRLMDGNYSLYAFMPGTWWRYALDVAAPGDYTVVVRAQTNEKDRTIRVQIDGADVGTIAVPQTHETRADYRNRIFYWGEAAIEKVALRKGKQALTLVAEGDAVHVDRIDVFPTGKPWPCFGIPAPMPGLIEAEYFDRGGEGIGYHREQDKQTVTKPTFNYPIKLNDWTWDDLAFMVLRPLERAMPIGGVGRDETDACLPAWGGNFCINWGGGEFPSWTAYTVNVAQPGPYDFTFRFNGPAGPDGRQVNYQLLLDDHELVNQANFKGKSEAGKWEHTLQSVKLPQGLHVLKVVKRSWEGGGLDWIRFTRASAPATPRPE